MLVYYQEDVFSESIIEVEAESIHEALSILQLPKETKILGYEL